jgi:tRNA A37 N6-isopentenylltransferase MiaA
VGQHLAGELDPSASSGQAQPVAVARIKTATHRLARQQATWFRRDDPRIRWIDVSLGEPSQEAVRLVESELGLGRAVGHGR